MVSGINNIEALPRRDMKLTSTDEFSLDGKCGAPSSQLLFRQQRTGIVFDHAILGPTFEHDGRYIVFVVDDALTEESLRMAYISESMALLDQIQITSLYSAGSLDNLAVIDDCAIEFSFFSDERWRLTVHRIPKLVVTLPWGLSKNTRGVLSSVSDTVRRRHLELRRLVL